MHTPRFGIASAALLALASVATPLHAQQGLGDEIWDAASIGDVAQVDALTRDAAASGDPRLAEIAQSYLDALDEREKLREEQREESWKEIREVLEGEPTDIEVSEALAQLARLTEITPDRGDVIRRSETQKLVKLAENRAEAADFRGGWLMANELIFRLDAVFDVERTYREQLRIRAQRLNMLQLYAPERLWELRNERRIEGGDSPLPAYNPLGDDYRDKLDGIRIRPTIQGVYDAATRQVDRGGAGALQESIVSGLDAIESLVTTPDLRATFPELNDAETRVRIAAWIEQERDRVLAGDGRDRPDLERVVEGLLRTVERDGILPREVALHEFGVGALAIYDDYSGIFWPEDVRRFQRTTQGNFVGVGISVQLDELQNIKVVTPLEGTPAQRAGIRSGDIIKFVDGISTAGLGLNQAVEIITGPRGTEVVLGVERVKEGQEDVEDPETEIIDVPITRDQIVVKTVYGWEREGDEGWNWFIDKERGIGFVRMTQFTGSTSGEFDRAIREMREEGLTALVLDLRFNPGGLLNQAVEVADRFLPRGAEIVSTQNAQGRVNDRERAGRTPPLGDIPVVVLINNGAASASEIVSGALQDHARLNDADVLVLGERSFGKGSVQIVSPLRGGGGQMALKLTTQYYRLPSGRVIHRKPGATQWGIDPDFPVEMLPSQESEALLHRRDADILRAADEVVADQPNPEALFTDGIDPQLQAALLLLRARTADEAALAGAPREDDRP